MAESSAYSSKTDAKNNLVCEAIEKATCKPADLPAPPTHIMKIAREGANGASYHQVLESICQIGQKSILCIDNQKINGEY